MDEKDQKPTAAFVLSLLSALWMMAASLMMYGFAWHDMDGWMGGRGPGRWFFCGGVMRDIAPGYWWPSFGTIAGVIVLICAAAMYAKPAQCRSAGIVILVVSALNILLGAGGFLAGVMGIIGGILALNWRPQS